MPKRAIVFIVIVIVFSVLITTGFVFFPQNVISLYFKNKFFPTKNPQINPIAQVQSSRVITVNEKIQNLQDLSSITNIHEDLIPDCLFWTYQSCIPKIEIEYNNGLKPVDALFSDQPADQILDLPSFRGLIFSDPNTLRYWLSYQSQDYSSLSSMQKKSTDTVGDSMINSGIRNGINPIVVNQLFRTAFSLVGSIEEINYYKENRVAISIDIGKNLHKYELLYQNSNMDPDTKEYSSQEINLINTLRKTSLNTATKVILHYLILHVPSDKIDVYMQNLKKVSWFYKLKKIPIQVDEQSPFITTFRYNDVHTGLSFCLQSTPYMCEPKDNILSCKKMINFPQLCSSTLPFTRELDLSQGK